MRGLKNIKFTEQFAGLCRLFSHSFASYIPEIEGCERFQFRTPVPQSAGDGAFFQGNRLLLLCLILLVSISGGNNVHALFRTTFLEFLYSNCFC